MPTAAGNAGKRITGHSPEKQNACFPAVGFGYNTVSLQAVVSGSNFSNRLLPQALHFSICSLVKYPIRCYVEKSRLLLYL
ncbi:hypothetical protein AB833_19345 [Chromatiales bacterium (ex Bugula neritina AB1)]|nr:hypothetical protein AB833_19345 [Chromatiales bacterium (ex Bugula neritina AB1)]